MGGGDKLTVGIRFWKINLSPGKEEYPDLLVVHYCVVVSLICK